jgi:hypothetical protein
MKHTRWKLDADALDGLTPEDARDLLIECFVIAQEATFIRTRERLRLNTNAAELTRTLTAVVRMAFADLGYDFERPTADALNDVADHLARQAAQFGTPNDVVRHHREEFSKVTSALVA